MPNEKVRQQRTDGKGGWAKQGRGKRFFDINRKITGISWKP
jgi:hypothetical protein